MVSCRPVSQHPDDRDSVDLPPLDPSERITVASRLAYFTDSRQPLTMLVFLLPLVLVYELGALFFMTGGDAGSSWEVSAQRVLSSVFEVFGVAGLHLPAVLLVVVLLIWQALSREPWRVKPAVLLGMTLESAAMAIPLIVLAALIAPSAAALIQHQGQAVGELGWPARTTISIGAGLYEEMLFRLIGITALHFLLADLVRLPTRWATGLAVVISAGAFAAYHDIPTVEVGVFYFLAGAYFGMLYVLRGFGSVVACHAAYDLVALVIGPAAITVAA